VLAHAKSSWCRKKLRSLSSSLSPRRKRRVGSVHVSHKSGTPRAHRSSVEDMSSHELLPCEPPAPRLHPDGIGPLIRFYWLDSRSCAVAATGRVLFATRVVAALARGPSMNVAIPAARAMLPPAIIILTSYGHSKCEGRRIHRAVGAVQVGRRGLARYPYLANGSDESETHQIPRSTGPPSTCHAASAPYVA